MGNELNIKTTDNITLYANEYLPENIKACIIVIHGMAEHSLRYENFAEFLYSKDIAVYTYDQRGHGKTAGSVENLGFFSEKDGWSKVVDDLHKLVEFVKEKNKSTPLFLLGHSMGSFVVRTYISEYDTELSGVLLSGTAGDAGLLGSAGILVSKLISSLKGKRHPSKLMDSLGLGSFNKNFKPARTQFDWLTRDNEIVDKYINDPYCGSIFTAGFYNDMLKGLKYVNSNKAFNNINKDLPIYLFCGNKDPVGNNSKQVKEVFEKYKKNGIKKVELKIYDDARHETLNETNKEEVYNNIHNFIAENINTK